MPADASSPIPAAFGRITLDVLRSGRTRPEVSYDDQLPEFTVTLDDAPARGRPVALGDSVSLALLTVLDSLRPVERLAFVLHDVFAVPFAEIGPVLGKSSDATKMLTTRARGKVQAAQQPASVGRQQREVAQAFLAAARDGQFEQLLQVCVQHRHAHRHHRFDLVWPAPVGAGHTRSTNGQPLARPARLRSRSEMRLPSGSAVSMRTPNP